MPSLVQFRSSGSYSAKGPSKQLKSWESGAKLVQNTTVENKYLEHIRDVHDPSQHLKTIEDELKGTIGKALGKQGQKILMYARLMDQERHKYDNSTNNSEKNEFALAHNNYRKECLHARWELIVHRQAVGFTVGNHKYVMEKFPVLDALPVVHESDGNSEEGTPMPSNKNETKRKKFTDQYDWWARIGRWK